MSRTFEVGAVGWDHSEWLGAFYPDSLPDDWRLTYYSNEFRWVLVPAEYWQSDITDPAQWLEDVHEQFNFLLEVPCNGGARGVPDPAAIMAAAEPLGGHLRGVVLRLSPGHLPAPERLDWCLALGDDGLSVHVDCCAALPDELVAVITQAGARRCWRPAHTEPREQCHIGVLTEADVAGGRRALRAHVEAFIGQAGTAEAELVMLFEGNPPKAHTMQDAQVIASLLGV